MLPIITNNIYAAHLCCAFCGKDSLFLQSTIEYPLHYGPLKKSFVLSLTFSFWPGLQSAHRNPHCRTQLQIRLLHSLPLLCKSRNMILQHPGHQKEPSMQNSVLRHCCDTSRLTVPPQTESYWIVFFSIYNSIPFYTSKRFGHVSMHTIHYEPHPKAFKLSGQYWDHPWSGLRLQKPEDARRQIVQSSSKIFKLFESFLKEKQRKAPQISAFSVESSYDAAIHPFHTRVGWSMSFHFIFCSGRCNYIVLWWRHAEPESAETHWKKSSLISKPAQEPMALQKCTSAISQCSMTDSSNAIFGRM